MIRLRSFAIQNFRTFRERTVIDLTGASETPDAVATFHGDNGSGKSNALAALSFFFEGLKFLLGLSVSRLEVSVSWEQLSPFFRQADMPQGASERSYVEVELEGATVQEARLSLGASGKKLSLMFHVVGAVNLEKEALSQVELLALTHDDEMLRADIAFLTANRGQFFIPFPWMKDLLWAAFFPKDFERTFGSINARRQVLWLKAQESRSILPPEIAEGLFALRTSLQPEERQAWRSYTEQFKRIPTLQRFEAHIELDRKSSQPRLVFEDPGLSVLTLEQLSSGEQQLVVLLAVALLARASILAIEEPEISLDTKNQALLRELLEGLVQSKAIGQVIIESHAPSFDGPQVVRFSRDESGASRASRESASRVPVPAELGQQAKERGAQSEWVTADGYTRLPENMLKDIGLAGRGGELWFLRGVDAWEAWKGEELAAALRGGSGNEGDAS